jgi:hypothetical protein
MTPKNTPWGPANRMEELAQGIIMVSTASHGGIWLSQDRRMEISQYNNNFLKTAEWWEEDCDWAVPYTFFAEDIQKQGKACHFEENLKVAFAMVKRLHPHFVPRLAGRLNAGLTKVEDDITLVEGRCDDCLYRSSRPDARLMKSPLSMKEP